ncbi:MAG: undecaprenyldiphospho-muramoylpentapeptide beta-N-acetylglucosaminyltransferase [Bacteroidetes bacterium]|nr:undecaprenyldiphospho-muramoylpentapeptide beta-N-acetylglucosaminyltransferase [Bacteroidota bacterium]
MNILVAAGGTGGDLFPAVAVIEQLQKLIDKDLSVTFVGNPNRIEATVVPELNYEFFPISITGFKGLTHRSTPLLPLRIVSSIVKVRAICKKKKIDAILCGGTYISFPVGIVAKQLNIPMMLLEPNVLPGKTNKLLAKRATTIILAFEQSKKYFPIELHNRMLAFGNPVRESMVMTLPNKASARVKFGLHPDKPSVFVFGGSLGAHSINNIIENSLEKFAQNNIQLIWQIGNTYPQPKYLPEGIMVRRFIDDMASAYSAADLVVCRAGGGTVAELTNVGKPSILIPLPTATNNEQFYNARILEEGGASKLLTNDILKDKLFTTIQELIQNPKILIDMSNSAKLQAKPDAAYSAALELKRIATKATS